MNDALALLLGVVLAAAGGEMFVRAILIFSQWWRIRPAVVAVTLAAFATSAPELSVAVNAALDGRPEIALGDALGANVINVAMVLAIAAVILPVAASRAAHRREFAVALGLGPVVAAMAIDGVIGRGDAIALYGLFAVWLMLVVLDARRNRDGVAAPVGRARFAALPLFVVGLAGLLLAGEFFVQGASGIARSAGLSTFVIGATIVAIGTTVPELATTIAAQMRGRSEIGLGTILGSNIFNVLFVVPTTGIILPIPVEPIWLMVAIGFGMAAIAVAALGRGERIGRPQGCILLVLWAAYLGVMVFLGHN